MSVDINKLLEQRRKTHGRYELGTAISYGIKDAIRRLSNEMVLDEYKIMTMETLDMLAHKIARIISGSVNKDDWVDIAGYSQLMINYIEREYGEKYEKSDIL